MRLAVTFCCCGCSLRLGTLILLWLKLITSIAAVAMIFTVYPIHLNFTSDGVSNSTIIMANSTNGEVISTNAEVAGNSTNGGEDDDIDLSIGAKVYFSLESIVGITVYIIGLLGVFKGTKKFLLPFYYFILYAILVTLVAMVIFAIDTDLYNSIFISINNPFMTDNFVVKIYTIVVTVLFGIVLQGYFAIVVKSFYHTMDDKDSKDSGFSFRNSTPKNNQNLIKV